MSLIKKLLDSYDERRMPIAVISSAVPILFYNIFLERSKPSHKPPLWKHHDPDVIERAAQFVINKKVRDEMYEVVKEDVLSSVPGISIAVDEIAGIIWVAKKIARYAKLCLKSK